MTLDVAQLNWLAVVVGALVYFALGIGLSLAHTFVDASFSPEKPQPWTWFAINGTYHALGLVIVSVIIATWQ